EGVSLRRTERPYEVGDPASDLRVAALYLGIKKNILDCMVARGCYVKVFPAKTPFSEIRQMNPDGYFISNGPGDPAAMDYAIQTVKQILDDDRILFGICLGHQLLALANDIPTFKMHHGHRGLNHPVKNVISGRGEITAQNHGLCFSPHTLFNHPQVEVTHVNLNDESIEGIRLKNKPVFSVQYHPESTPGPHDSRYLFDEFIGMI